MQSDSVEGQALQALSGGGCGNGFGNFEQETPGAEEGWADFNAADDN